MCFPGKSHLVQKFCTSLSIRNCLPALHFQGVAQFISNELHMFVGVGLAGSGPNHCEVDEKGTLS